MAIGVREAKALLSQYLRRVKAGEVVTITDRGRWPKIPRHKASVTVATLLDDDRGE
jgi:hypothetical protein